MATTRKTAAREPLDRDRIVAASLALADQEGLDALSMRHVARRLGFEVMALYNHVASKDELLAAMIDAVAAEIQQPPTELAALAAVRAMAVAEHDVLVRHPWAPGIWLRHLPGPARTQRMETLLRLFANSGLAPELAHHGYHAVENHVLGYTIQQLGMRASPGTPNADAAARSFLESVDGIYPHAAAHVREHLDGRTTSSFEFVLDLILDGLVRINATS